MLVGLRDLLSSLPWGLNFLWEVHTKEPRLQRAPLQASPGRGGEERLLGKVTSSRRAPAAGGRGREGQSLRGARSPCMLAQSLLNGNTDELGRPVHLAGQGLMGKERRSAPQLRC